MQELLDCFKELTRPQLFSPEGDNETFIESIIKFGNNSQSSANTGMTLFGEMQDMQITRPNIPTLPEYDLLKFLNMEKEHIGMYLSGHPLDPFRFIINTMKITPLREMDDEDRVSKIRNLKIVGFVTDIVERMTKNGKPYGKVSMIDYTGSYSFAVFGKDYTDNKNLFVKGYSIMVFAEFRESKADKNRTFFTVNKVELLSELKDTLFSKLTIQLSVDNINEEFITELLKIVKKNKGKINLNFSIYNSLDNTSIKLFSRTERVELTDEFVEFIENNPNLENISLN